MRMYTFDASSIIHAWDNYPIAQFPPMWGWVSEQIVDDTFSIPLVAMEEVEQKTPKCFQWLKDELIPVLPLTALVIVWVRTRPSATRRSRERRVALGLVVR
jgi:hypothetical protein